MNKLISILRACFRLSRIGLHLLGGMATVVFVYPFSSRLARLRLKQRWSYRALLMFGVRLRTEGQHMAHMRISNHISWLDIVIVNAVIPSAFVAKDDVRGWPVIGWLSENTDTYFMQRGSRQAAHKASQHVASLLQADIDVVVFPEGTTSRGDQVLPFYGALIQGAIAAKVPIQPLVIRYYDAQGKMSEIPAYCGDLGLGESMWRVACADYLAVTLYFLPAIDSVNHDRRTLAAALRESINMHLAKISQPINGADTGPTPIQSCP